ncbi:hypothetical protein GCM10009007_17010 [Formosimonas limnophila]|uniref:Methyltransferase type 11 domain-containing protein n=1 Tax=Formosimonas limnophila TaxID=1384487 RepID=A0A8J3CM42_9BURK|nr:hypothetical protein [Formosimonas limnophila]GHA76630.1 hypothetical protein GCM10009007_17010 [Formosimonas limnophila]
MLHLIQEKIKTGESIKLNLDCGYSHTDDFINIDKFANSVPDWVMDIEQMPWTIPNDTVDEMVMAHVLEHIGQEAAVYMSVWQQLYRVCRDGVLVHIVVHTLGTTTLLPIQPMCALSHR